MSSVGEEDSEGIYTAIARGDLVGVLKCTHAYGTYDIRDADGSTLFHKFAIYDQVEMLHVFANRDPSLICTADKNGYTPLHMAIIYQASEAFVTELILLNKAVLDQHAHDGATPLHTAVQTHQAKYVRLLLSLGSKACDRQNIYGHSPRTHAQESKYMDCLELMPAPQQQETAKSTSSK